MENPYEEGPAQDARIVLFEKMMNDPDARKQLEKAVNKVAPQYVPQVGLEQTIEEKMSKMKAEYEAALAKRDEEFNNFKAQEEINNQINNLKAKGMTEEGIKEIKDLMVKKGIVQFDTAKEYYEKNILPSKPVNTEPIIPKLEDNLYKADTKKNLIARKNDFFANVHNLVDNMHAEGKI